MSRAINPFFLPSAGAGQRLCVHHRARGTAVGAIVYVHPFAEEMNKSRRMAALQSRAFAAAGFDVLQIDLHGCGDSSGDFGDASWEQWIADVVDAAAWLRRLHAAPLPLSLWGLRAGCLLAAAAAARLDPAPSLIFWQPPASGKPLLAQFLRLRVAAQLLTGAGQGLTQQLRSELARGQSLEIAGYRLAPALADGLEAAELRPLPGTRRVDWFELSTRADADLLPVSRPVIERWRDAGVEVHAQAVCGPAFWQTTETEEAPMLIRATTDSVAAALAA